MIDNLPAVPDWISATSIDKFVPFLIEIMMNVSAGLYDYFVPLLTMLMWTLVAFNLAVFVIKQYIPGDYLGFLGIGDGGKYYNDAASMSWGIPERLAKQIMRGAIATTILLGARPAFLTEVIINPFLSIGTTYTEFILNASNVNANVPAAPARQCETRDFFSPEVCTNLSNPIAGIIYKNNQVVTLGLTMMSIPAFMTGAPRVRGGDLGGWLFNFIVGLALVATFFISGLLLASLLIQGILNFCFEIMLFPFKAFKFVMQSHDTWANPWVALEGIITSLRKLVVSMIVSGIMVIINVTLIGAMFGAGGLGSEMNSWADKFTTLLGCVLCIVVLYRLFDIAQEKMTAYGASVDKEFYGNLTGAATNLGKQGVGLAKKTKGMIGKIFK